MKNPVRITYDKPIIVFNLNSYNDGLGDSGHLVDISSYILGKVGEKNISPYFIISGNNYQEAESMFKVSMKRFSILPEQIHIFDYNDRRSAVVRPSFSKKKAFIAYVESNKALEYAYNNAFMVFNISIPFLYGDKLWDRLLKENIKPINITEHNACSYVEHELNVGTIKEYLSYRIFL